MVGKNRLSEMYEAESNNQERQKVTRHRVPLHFPPESTERTVGSQFLKVVRPAEAAREDLNTATAGVDVIDRTPSRDKRAGLTE